MMIVLYTRLDTMSIHWRVGRGCNVVGRGRLGPVGAVMRLAGTVVLSTILVDFACSKILRYGRTNRPSYGHSLLIL